MTKQEKNRVGDQQAFLSNGGCSTLRIVVLRFCWGVMLAALFLAGSVMAESEDPKPPPIPSTQSSGVDVNLSITVVPEPCDVGISGSDINGSELNFGSLLAAEFSQAGYVSRSKTFNLELTNCGDPDVAPNGPALTVSGNTIDAEHVSIFRDPSGSDDSASEGLGFIFHLGPEGKINLDSDLVINNRENPLSYPLVKFDDGRAQLPVTVAVARGKDIKVIRPGSLVARVAFTYSYP
ncbi:fimbrial protein [Photorhabdus luminescens]|uniref:Type 1 fimbrial protein n=1 Tax=Photorhabdus luminescens subsp. sonorensis TaxID=1173677 RepID=A0A5C4RM78_PHOLU|nr:fimbrial protein [Photorhabdus luminescens]TNH44968.1 type 1 fimbrial protein [Photorhabdus luminescens subsp. sonorensis]